MTILYTREQVLEQADMLDRDGYGNAAAIIRQCAEMFYPAPKPPNLQLFPSLETENSVPDEPGDGSGDQVDEPCPPPAA